MSKKLTTKEFIARAKEVHGDKYDYSKVNYIDSKTKICIICPQHGEFWQLPHNHLKGQGGCKKCSNISKTKTAEEWLEKAKKVHGNKYDYSKSNYVNGHTKICIICPQHGEFWQIPNDHIYGKGCRQCAQKSNGDKRKNTKDELLKRFQEIHDNKYNYLNFVYNNSREKISIICPQHGEFQQTIQAHLRGQGCPICKDSKLEQEIRLFLKKNKITFIEQKRFTWLGKQSLDFYLPQYSIGIECQGKQHFGIGGWGEEYSVLQKRDEVKFNSCQEHGVKILYYSNLGITYPYQVYEDKEELLKKIINE